MDNKKTEVFGSFIAAAIVGFTLGLVPMLFTYLLLDNYTKHFERMDTANNRVLVKCDDSTTEWQPLPVCKKGKTDENNNGQ